MRPTNRASSVRRTSSLPRTRRATVSGGASRSVRSSNLPGMAAVSPETKTFILKNQPLLSTILRSRSSGISVAIRGRMRKEHFMLTRQWTRRLAQSMAVALLLVSAASAQRHIPAGTQVTVQLSEELNSGKATEGQTWSGTLANDVTSPSGKILARRGSPVTGVVSEAKDSGRLHAPGVLSVRLTDVNGVSVRTDTITRDGEGHTKSNVTKVGGGTAGGALIGGLAGG